MLERAVGELVRSKTLPEAKEVINSKLVRTESHFCGIRRLDDVVCVCVWAAFLHSIRMAI